jgi:hypothetical protein
MAMAPDAIGTGTIKRLTELRTRVLRLTSSAYGSCCAPSPKLTNVGERLEPSHRIEHHAWLDLARQEDHLEDASLYTIGGIARLFRVSRGLAIAREQDGFAAHVGRAPSSYSEPTGTDHSSTW